jgi:hypothetical protein
MEFKKLEIEPEGNWLKRTLWSQHGKKTILYIALGAIAGFVILLITEQKQFAELTSGEIVKSLIMGGFFGFFITNSPCARNKC